VLHRDLKPSNILLGKYGETLLVDWGLAKATGRPDPARGAATEGPLRPQSGGSHTPTLAGQKMGTPAYMSPEQARGELERLGPATDVYSLGATLYCLLTGRPPVQGADDAVVTQHVIEGRIPAPRSVRSDLDPALDAICRQALANRPEDRYASALDLADDIERWLGDQPVTAYAEPWTRRLGRWARRHRTLVTTAGAVLGVLAAALAVGLWRVDQERQRTLRQFGSAHGLAASLVETAEKTLSQTPGQEALRKGLFDQAATSYDLLVAERRDDPALLREAGMVHFYKGNLLRFGNETDAADQEFQRARGLLDAARRLDPENLAVQDRLVELERDRAQLATRLGRDRQARASLEQALEAVGAVLQRDAANLDARRTEASLLASLVAAEVNLGQDAQALEHARTVVDRYRSLAQQGVDREKSTPAYATSTGERLVPLLYVMSLNRLADLQREGGKLDEALATSELAVARITPLVNAAKTPDNLSQTASTLRVRGEILAALLGREADARAAYDEALGILAALIQANGRSAAYREARGTTLRLRAELARRQNRADEARADLEASLADYDWLTKNAANIPRFWNGLGLTRAARAELLAAEGGEGASTARDQAITALRKAVSLAPDNVPFSRDLERVGGNGGRATGRKGTPPGP
jgi:serine/threonine-protein kinase